MKTFNEYWKEKAQKRRKSWAAKAKRFAERHLQLAAIRSEVVYSRMDRIEVLSLLNEHRTVQNPIARWEPNMHFSFSEQGLREAMQAEGADVSSLTVAVSKKNIVGQQPHEIAYGDMLDLASNRRDLYEKYTDLEICTINYREVTMVIYRYTYLQQPFALYEFLPCKQLSFSNLRLEETSFSTLNIANLLMEIAAEYELRQEELNYHAKKLRLRTMDAALADGIEFELWDDKKLEKKVAEYVSKDYPVEKMLELVLRPWKQAITKYFRDITEQELQNPTEKLAAYSLRSDFPYYVKNVLQPYFNKQGLQEVKMWRPNEKSQVLYIKNQGCLAKFVPWDDAFYPNAHYSMCCIYGELNKSPLRALSYFLQKMPDICKKTDEWYANRLSAMGIHMDGPAPSEGDSYADGEAGEGGASSSSEPSEKQGENSAGGSSGDYTSLWEEDAFMGQQITDIIHSTTQWGSLPGGMVELIRKAAEGKIDYRNALRAFRSSILSQKRHLTRMYPSRRFGFGQMGSRYEFTTRLLVAIDTSGSVGSEELGRYYRIITTFFKYGIQEIDVLMFDFDVQGEPVTLKEAQKSKQTFEVKGRGGTNFQAPVNYVAEHPGYDGLIIMTDGYAPVPNVPAFLKTKLLWVIDNEPSYKQHYNALRKTGRVCLMQL